MATVVSKSACSEGLAITDRFLREWFVRACGTHCGRDRPRSELRGVWGDVSAEEREDYGGTDYQAIDNEDRS